MQTCELMQFFIVGYIKRKGFDVEIINIGKERTMVGKVWRLVNFS